MAIVWRTLPWLVLLAMAALAVGLAVLPAEALFARIPINYNEGWNAFHTLRLRQGGPLYPPLSEAVFINYPPLSFYVTAALYPVVGDDIFAGRLVALVAELAVTLNIALAARALGVRWLLCGIAGCAFFAFVAICYSDYVAMDDPQWLGHALQTVGLVVLLRRNRLDWGTLAIVALLFGLGGLVKQNLVALPLAVTVWLALEDRRALLRWLVCGIALAALALAACVGLYGQGFVDQVLRSERSVWTTALAFVAQTLSLRLAPFVIFAAAGVLLHRADRRARLVGIYLGIALVTGIGMLAIDGVAYNALFDLTIAMMVGAALAFDGLVRRLGSLPTLAPAGPFIAALVFALPLLVAGRGAFAGQASLELDLQRQVPWQQSIDRIAAAPGPLACETLALCYWAGRPSEIDFFNFGQYAGLHPAFADGLVGRIGDGRLALIQEDGGSGSARLPAAVNAAIAARYRPAQQAPTVLLAPIAAQ